MAAVHTAIAFATAQAALLRERAALEGVPEIAFSEVTYDLSVFGV